jgi:hypothetical protein
MMKLWLRAATCVSVVFLVGWYFVYGQNMFAEISDAQRYQNQQLVKYQDCENFRHTGVSKRPADLAKFICEVIAPQERPTMTSSWQMLTDDLTPVVEMLLVIWGLFAGLQWLIRGALT